MVATTIAPETPVTGVASAKDNGCCAVVTKSDQRPAPSTASQETLEAPLSNPSLVVTADHRLKAEEAPVFAPKPGEALVHVKATGVCGSDIHFWKTGRIGSLVFEGDCIIGHEAAGVVIRCGEGVKNLRPGDRVAIEPGVPCGECFLCTDGRYNLCENVQFAGVYPYHGTIQRYKCHPAKWLHKYASPPPAQRTASNLDGCASRHSSVFHKSRNQSDPASFHRLPDNISYAEGALLEPLSVGMHGIRTAGLSLGVGAVVCGAGPIGLVTLAAARASGAHPLVITDIEPSRLAFAKTLVPSVVTYQVDPALGNEANGRAIRKLFGDDEYGAPRTVLECTGVESSICAAAFAVRRGGTVVVIGVGREIVNNLPFMHISLAEIKLEFINRYRDTWPAGIACLSSGILDLKSLVSHTFPLEKAVDALALASDYRNGSIKVQIVDEIESPIF
ncbi:putative sorbitol dehydrogenase [Colletotrichum sublineola]|uniref:L-arabinitol 4-dehydrogenase n=1 Tax=Colletotrichum sublineola TaxID=1173701 RepID=A0A066XFJ9_COLSU|nr:putative sorbitol dehydrogenase [Colletotrichum sublineola]